MSSIVGLLIATDFDLLLANFKAPIWCDGVPTCWRKGIEQGLPCSCKPQSNRGCRVVASRSYRGREGEIHRPRGLCCWSPGRWPPGLMPAGRPPPREVQHLAQNARGPPVKLTSPASADAAPRMCSVRYTDDSSLSGPKPQCGSTTPQRFKFQRRTGGDRWWPHTKRSALLAVCRFSHGARGTSHHNHMGTHGDMGSLCTRAHDSFPCRFGRRAVKSSLGGPPSTSSTT